MDVQTESHTPLPVPDPGEICFAKAMMNGERVFVLRSQDISAPLVIDFWVKIQQRLREYVTQGFTAEEAEKFVRKYYFLDQLDVPLNDPKLSGACAIAGEMEKWPGRKLAD